MRSARRKRALSQDDRSFCLDHIFTIISCFFVFCNTFYNIASNCRPFRRRVCRVFFRVVFHFFCKLVDISTGLCYNESKLVECSTSGTICCRILPHKREQRHERTISDVYGFDREDLSEYQKNQESGDGRIRTAQCACQLSVLPVVRRTLDSYRAVRALRGG